MTLFFATVSILLVMHYATVGPSHFSYEYKGFVFLCMLISVGKIMFNGNKATDDLIKVAKKSQQIAREVIEREKNYRGK